MAQLVKNPTCKAGDPGSIPRLGSSPEEGHGNPLQYSCLENPYGQKSQTTQILSSCVVPGGSSLVVAWEILSSCSMQGRGGSSLVAVCQLISICGWGAPL